MKLLVCINGQPASLEAARTAARLSRLRAGKVCFLYVRRSGHRSRGYSISGRAEQVISGIQEPASELLHLSEARKVFSEAGGFLPNAGTASNRRDALVQVGHGIFEKATVDIAASDDLVFRIREGFPHEEILREANSQACDLILMGSHPCNWYDAENIPLLVMKKSPCAVLTVQKPIPDKSDLLVMPDAGDLSAPHWQLISDLALSFSSRLHLLTASAKNHADAPIPAGLNPKIPLARERSDTDPLRFAVERKPAYDLYLFPPNQSVFFSGANRTARKIFCLGLNVLTLR